MDPLLILLDLDNTLVDRDDAFARWAEQFVAEHGGGADVLDWLLSVDGHGYTHRAVLAEAVGAKEPAAEIFAAATGAPSGRPGWMVGDHVEADMAGGRAAGLRTGWVSHGRTWPDADPPTLSAPTTAEVLDLIAARRGAR